MKTALRILFLLFIAAACTACSGMGMLKAGPAADSGFLKRTGDLAVNDESFPFHRTYFPEGSREQLKKIQRIHVAEVNTDFLQNRSIYFRTEQAAREAIAEDAEEMKSYARNEFERELRENGIGRFMVVDEPTKDALILELALVELTPTDVARNVVGTTIGSLVPGSGLVSTGSTGTVAIEGRLRDAGSDRVLLAFADREAGKLALFNLKDFSLYGHAREIIQDWAAQVTETMNSSGEIRVVDSSPITLSPL